MEAEYEDFQKESPFLGADFQVPCLTSGVYITRCLSGETAEVW